jgi:hypothetical protein
VREHRKDNHGLVCACVLSWLVEANELLLLLHAAAAAAVAADSLQALPVELRSGHARVMFASSCTCVECICLLLVLFVLRASLFLFDVAAVELN